MAARAQNGLRKTVTMVDIASKCGVSVAAVSYALRGTNGEVSEETRSRIMSVAREMGYDPSRNQAARRMVFQRNGTLVQNRSFGVALPTDTRLTSYFAQILDGIMDVAAEQSYGVHFTRFGRPGSLLPPVCSRGEVDGVITVVSSGWFGHWVQRLREEPNFSERPIVGLVDPIPSCSCVHVDDYRAGHLAGTHLLELGHRHVLHDFGPMESTPGYLDSVDDVMAKRLDGVRRAYRENGLNADDYLRWQVMPHGSSDAPKYGPSLIRLLGDNANYTAIIAQNDCAAVQIWSILSRAGIRVPEDISLIGFDDTEAIMSGRGENILTTIRIPLFEIGQEGARLMIRAIDDEVRNIQNIVLAPDLIVRASTDRPRSDVSCAPR